MKLVIKAKGHPNIRATHKSTWQFTKEDHLTPRGDCIIGVAASHSALELSTEIKGWLQKGNWVAFELQVGELIFRGKGQGNSDLQFTDSHDMVFRRSDFISERTVTINTDFAAIDLPEKLRTRLLDPNQEIYLTISPIDQNQEHL